MDRRTLLVLCGVTVALAAIWYLTPNEIGPNNHPLLFPGFKDQLNAVERMTVSVGGDQIVATLERGADRWTVAERFGYPADVSKIRQNLIALGNATIVEKMTSNPDLYERLGIEDLDRPGAKGYLLEIYQAGQDEGKPFGLIVGDTGVHGKMAYIRRPEQEQGLMISADFDLGKETADWLARDLIDIPSADIQAITISHPDGEVVRIEKSSRTDSNFSVPNIPQGQELAYASVANPVAGLLTKLEMDDVSPADSVDTALTKPIVARFETFDNLVVEARVYVIDDKTMVAFSVTADEPLAAQASELNSRLESWVYSLPSFKSEQLIKHLDDFLKTDGE